MGGIAASTVTDASKAVKDRERLKTMRVEAKLQEMGLALPAEMWVPPGFRVNWRQIRVIGTRAIIAGHGPRKADGTFAGPGGKVGLDLTVEQGYAAARATGLAILGDLKRELGDLTAS